MHLPLILPRASAMKPEPRTRTLQLRVLWCTHVRIHIAHMRYSCMAYADALCIFVMYAPCT